MLTPAFTCCEQSRIPPANRLPLCYLMDSVLKNVGEPYIGMFGAHVAAMACRTYEHVSHPLSFSFIMFSSIRRGSVISDKCHCPVVILLRHLYQEGCSNA
jgi:hypothetical protein